MFSSGPNYSRLKTNLRLAVNRLKLLEKKKTELGHKARKEIADYIGEGKYERAKIRVEVIIREDYLVEAMELLEMYCDMILSRFGLLQEMKEMDPSLEEAISSLLWAAPRLWNEIVELKVISEQLTTKFGKKYSDSCRNGTTAVSEKLRHKMSIQAPPKILVEKYLIEIAKIYNMQYTPDPQVMREYEQSKGMDALLFDPGTANNLDSITRPTGFVDFPQEPIARSPPPFNYPVLPPGGPPGGGAAAPSPIPYNIPPTYMDVFSAPPYDSTKTINSVPPYMNEPKSDTNKQANERPKPLPRSKMPEDPPLPELPSVPSGTLTPPPTSDSEEVDFGDIVKRFEELKKKK